MGIGGRHRCFRLATSKEGGAGPELSRLRISMGPFQSSFEFDVTEAGTVQSLLPCIAQNQYKAQSFVRKGIQ